MKIRMHFGVYAVILNKERTHVLLVEKAKGTYRGLLDLPGGGIDGDETREQALAREIAEETGCTMVSCTKLRDVYVDYDYTDAKEKTPARLAHSGALYTAIVEGAVREASNGSDVEKAGWFALADLKAEQLTPFARMGLEGVRTK